MKRRRLLATSAGLGLSAMGSSAAQALARAQAIAPQRRYGDVRDVAHIVVLTQENRAFDHYFAGLPGVRGFADPFPLPTPLGTVWRQPHTQGAPGSSLLPFHLDTRADFRSMRTHGTPHTWPDAQEAWDQGRMAAWTRSKTDHSMAYFGAEDIPFQAALANAFTLCDAYHCSFQGGTWPNRLYMWTGTHDPQGLGGGPALYNEFEDFGQAASLDGYTWTTYAERLQAAGVSWQVYQDLADNFGDNPFAGFRAFREAYHRPTPQNAALRQGAATTRALDKLREDVLAHRLPQVSWVVAPTADSEHPWRSSPAQGADYSARVLAALTADEAVWSRTVLLLNYDENDGYFDHLPPPAPPSVLEWDAAPSRRRLAGQCGVDTTGEYHERLSPQHRQASELRWLQRPYGLGPRVPMLVVSPWSRGGWVCSETFDHTSVLRLIERRFGVRAESISPWRRAVCGDLTSAFDFRRPVPGLPPAMPDTVVDARRAAAYAETHPAAPPPNAAPPRQATGTRPARALPYDLRHGIQRQGRRVRLLLSNAGRAAAVLHVLDRLQLAELPRRHTLLPRQRIVDEWLLPEQGELKLWLLGPNGWHRRIELRADGPDFELQLTPARAGLKLQLRNPGGQALAFELRPQAYADTAQPRSIEVAARGRHAETLPLAPHRWYDWSVSLQGGAVRTRFAGHVENGQPSISDPAMHGPAVLDLDAPRPA